MLEATFFHPSPSMANQKSKIKNRTARGGFSLIEVLLATVLIGLSIAALVAANGSFSMANVTGADLSTAEFLAEQIRELTTMLPVVDPAVPAGTFVTVLGPESGETLATYDDVDDFNGKTYSPPLASNRAVLNDLAAFSQHIVVQKLDSSNFDQTRLDTSIIASDNRFVRVTVNILQNGRPISSASWIRARY
jgi:prepilin-type N-terminal cleavage/methylation domain-containing protein